MLDIKFKLKNKIFPSFIFLSSGVVGMGIEYENLIDYSYVGAIITKAVTPLPRIGNKPPRLFEATSGLINSIGLANPGLEEFKKLLPDILKLNVSIIVNVAGDSIDDYLTVAKSLDNIDGIDGFEINISCPNVKKGGLVFGKDIESSTKLIKMLRKNIKKVLIIKLSAYSNSYIEIGKIAQKQGFDAISLVNTYPATAIDIEERKFILGNINGGLSGPAIKPMALYAVNQIKKEVSLPIIGGGGIVNHQDAIEFLLAGSNAVSIGTALFSEPNISKSIVDGTREYCYKNKFKSIKDIIMREK